MSVEVDEGYDSVPCVAESFVRDVEKDEWMLKVDGNAASGGGLKF
jgi:hypothetical protein